MKLIFVLIAATQLGNAEPLPLFFLPRVDNSDPIRFGAQSSDLQVGFARDFIALRSAGMQVQMRFVDASASATLEVHALSVRANIFEGRSADHWHVETLIYRKVAYCELYRGIDLFYGADGARIKSEFLVTAGADPSQIRFEYEGAVRVSIAKDGELIVSIEAGEFREQAPVIFQNSGSPRDHVNGRYRMLGPRTVGFEIGTYDMTRPLVIDPVITYCNYLGGAGVGAVTSIAVDSSGNLYVAGWTEALNFPIAGAVQSLNRGGVDAFQRIEDLNRLQCCSLC